MNVFEKVVKNPKNKKKKKKAQTFYGELSESKIVQLSEFIVYIVGGHANYPALVDGDYDVPKACLKLNLKTRELTRKKYMNTGRDEFGICSDGTFIYVVGGSKTSTCEKYNTWTDKWH